jgi:hypothetical protein
VTERTFWLIQILKLRGALGTRCGAGFVTDELEDVQPHDTSDL